MSPNKYQTQLRRNKVARQRLAVAKPLTLALPFELTNGNDGRGGKWFSSAKARKRIEADLRVLGLVPSAPFAVPVSVHVVRILGPGQRLWDSSSIGRGNWKEIEDALVAVGWFVDDSPQYITATTFDQDASRRSVGPMVEVTILRETA